MKGRSIVLPVEPKGVFVEGLCGGAINPGECVAVEAATEPVGGRATYISTTVGDADGVRVPVIVADIDRLQGRTYEDAYADGERFFGYQPQPGEEMNVRVQASVGNLAIGDLLIIDSATGELIATTGTPEMEPFEVLETSATSTSARYVHVRYTGN